MDMAAMVQSAGKNALRGNTPVVLSAQTQLTSALMTSRLLFQTSQPSLLSSPRLLLVKRSTCQKSSRMLVELPTTLLMPSVITLLQSSFNELKTCSYVTEIFNINNYFNIILTIFNF